MRSKNPEVMNAICTFVDQYYREHHASPSVNEIAQGVGVSKATSYRYLVAMNERGMLSYDGKTIVTKQVGKCTSGYFSAPVVGSIRCGDPEREEESVEEYVSLPESIFGEGKFYILRAKGDSMVDVILRYANQTKYPDKEIRVKQLIVQGVAKHVIKAL